MDLETAQTTTTAKLPILKQGEYDMWRLRIEQYFQVQDYALWDVIENGNSFKPVAQTTTNADGTSTSLIPGPVTTEEKVQKKNDVKARSMLLMALPNEHLMTFNQYKDAKTLFAAIQTRFGGNEATKKTQKTLLKQMYENFSAPSTESLDSIFNRLQKIVSQLAILGENISQENLSLKLLRSLPSEWNTHVVVKGTASSSSSSSSQNMVFVSSPSSTNEVNTAYGVSTANTHVSLASTASTQVSTANLSDDTVYAFLASQPNGSQLVYEDLEQIHEDDIEEMDLKWQLALLSMRIIRGPRNHDNRNINQDNSRRTVNVEETSSKAMVAIDGAGFNWSYMADDEVPTNMALIAFSDSEPEFEGYGPKTSKSVSEDISNEVRESPDAPLVNELLLDDKLKKKTIFPTVAKIEFVRPKQQEKPVRKPVKYAKMYKSQSPRGNQRNWNNQKLIAITIKGKRVVSGNSYTRVNYNYSAKRLTLVLTGTWPKAVNTARPNSVVVNVVRANQGTCPISQTSRNLIEDMLPLGEEPKEEKLLMCDKKNSVLFTDTECFVLSPDFKLANESQDETSGILKSFITKIENVVDKKVKIIRCDNGTEFKNKVMSEFCEQKGIKREYSVARTPQQNGVAERRNRTLIEAARTMLANSKLPTTFWTEVVNTVCYVQNRILIVKPQNKTPYELFRGRTPALSIMRAFGCHVTILNTLDYLGKFDGKSDEGFFVGYLINSKAFRVYNIRTRKVEEKLHIRFLEDKPIIAGDGPKWLFDIDVLTKSMNYVPVVAGTNSNDFAGIEESIGTGHSSKETRSSQDYILIPMWKDGSLFDYSLKNASNDEPQPSSDAKKKDDEGVNKESRIDDQEILENTTHADFFGDETEIDMSNITTTYLVPSTPNIRIHKDHSLDHVISDVQSGVLTRRMTKTTNKQGFISAVYEMKTHEDLHTCLFACFLSHEEPKKVWTLVDLPLVKRAIGTKWVYMNKKDERGIMIRNKSMLVAQGCTQEEGIDYDEVFALVARIEAIRSKKKLCTDFEKLMHKKFQMSSMGELTFFLGLQVTQKDYGIFVSQDNTPIETLKPLLKDTEAEDVDVHLYRSMIGSLMYLTSSRPDMMFVDSPFDLEAYSDSDYAGASLDRKSTTGGCQYLGSRLISWQCKKQTVVANSTSEAEYVATASCCGQVI
ncbi:putative ribonuclease H-like domain-containing protein [Tanacetum coccineum]|uniref:Ribonuclease H-like domain-containing protein n=1 Tax=Tanacetum coccineum TaxID=301880 RepID=A0ABQ5AEV2_9ASTR